jgi:uncharacterized membrane protein YoaK (UPF0700 family)
MAMPIPVPHAALSARRLAIAPSEEGTAAAARQARCRHGETTAISVDDSAATKLLPFLLSVIAGSVDTIGFLGLDGLFTAHVTGNLVILAARFLAGGSAPVAHLISVPVFILALATTKLLTGGLERFGIASLRPLLLLQLLLLSASLAITTAAGPQVDPSTLTMIAAAMLMVSAMAVQNALVRIALVGAPSTAVMTTNITAFTIDLGEMLIARNPLGIARARSRAKHSWPAIAGFLLGCALGAPGENVIGLRALALPAGLALVAVMLGNSARRVEHGRALIANGR